MGKYDTKRVQLHLIKTYKESFDEDKENFRNNSYNAFFNSYLNNCSDPYIRSYANKLKKIYQELEKGYENIDSWWKDFNSSIEGVENKLANNANSFTISDSNLIRMTNSLPVLENYDVSFAGLISVADANNTIIDSNSKNDINLSSGINSSNLKNGIFNQNKNNDGITMAFNKMAGATSIASGVNFATAFDNAFKTKNKSTDDNKNSKTASIGGVGVAAMSMAMGSVKTNNGVNESSTTTTKSSGKNMGYTSNDQEKNKTESQETEQTQREEITKENGYKNDYSYKNNRKEDILKQNNDNVFVKVRENTSAFVTVWKNVGAGISIIKNDINNKNFEGTKSSLKLVYANALASGVSTWNNIKTAAENVRKGTKEVIDNSIETAKIMAEKAETKVSNLWNDTKKSFDENWNNLKDTFNFSKNQKRNVENYKSYLNDKQYAQLEEQDKIWYESLEQDRNILDGLNKELNDLQYEYASAISMKNIQTPEEYKMDYESILFEEYMAFPDQYSEELKALELKREQAVKEYTDYFNYMLSTETRFKNIDEYNAAVNELKGKISNLNLSIHNKQQIYNMLPYMFIENSNEFEKSDIKLPYNYKISNEAFEKMVSTINSNVTSDIAVDTVNEGLKKTLADYGFASQSEFNEFRNTYLMTEEERKLYFYLKLENSGEAQKYLDAMQDTINQRKGLIEASKFLEKLKDEDDIGSKLTNFFLTFGEGTSDGIDNFYNGLDRALLGVDDTYSVSEYKNMIIISALMNDPSFKEYFENFDYDSISDKVKNKDDYDKYLQYTYQFSNSFGNMLPSMLTSIAVSAIATPAAGSAVSSTLLGVSAGGNNAEQAYKSGASLGDAYLYGVLSGISEGGMEYFLGTLTPFAKNAGGEVAKPFLMNFMKETIQEGGEEALQECVDSFLKYSILGEEISAEELGSAAFQSFVFGAAMKVFMDGSSAAIKVAGKTIAITPELLNLAKNGTPEEITAYVNNQSEIVENNIAQSPKENVETSSIPNIKTEDVQSEKITYKFNPEEKYSLKNKEWMSDYFDELAADYDDMGFISNKTGAQLEKLFLNDDYIIGIHRCGVANGTDIMNSGLNLTGHSSSGVESTNVELSSNISFFEQNATNFLLFIRGLKTASYYKSRNSNADALIVAIPKSEFESYDILDSRFIPKENNNLFDNLGSMSRLKSEYILGSINSDNGNLGDIKFNEKFNNQEFMSQMKNNNSLIENMVATINGYTEYNKKNLVTKLNSSIGEISTVLSKLITDISIKTENLATETKAKVDKIHSKISLKYKSDYYIKQEVYTKFNDYLSKLGIEVAPSQFDNMINDITFIKEKDWNQFLIDKGYQINLGYCDSNGKIFLPLKKNFEDSLDNLILHKLTTRVHSDSNFYGYYSGFQFLGYQFINGKWETGKLMCNTFNEATTQWINRKMNPASKSTYDNNVQILDRLIEGNVLNEQELINSYFAIDSGYLYKRFRELGIIDFADFANLMDQAYVKEQANGYSSFDQLYSIVSDLCFKAKKESSTVAETQLGVNNINEKLLNVTFDDGQFYVRANFEATMRNVPYNTIYEILYDDNTYARFLDYENNREYFNYISKGELALAIKYFERMNVVDESVTARANYIYDTVIKSNRLDKLHCVVNGAFNFIKSNTNYTMSIDTINNIIFNDEMYLDYLNNIDNLSTAQRYMSLLTFKEIYKNFLLDNVFIDSKYETRLKYLSNLCEQMYNYTDTELLKYSELGANQNSVRSLALNPLKNMKTYQSMTNIVKKYFPNMNQFEINKLLRLTDTRGICSYATEANEIFMLYAGREADFKREYGYDMYRFESGQRVLNDELLLTDLFCSANRSNEKILEKRTFGYKFATNDGGQIPMSVGVFDNTSLSKNIDQINNFFAEKGINMVCQSKILYADATGKPLNSKFLVDFIKDGLMAGNAYELDLFSVDGKPMDLTFYGMDSSTGNYKIAGSHSFGHSVSIAGFTSDGNVIVPSWGKRVFLKWSEIQKCRIVINETKYRRVL